MKDQKLWNNNFQWICESNFWIYNALYALLIGLPLMLEQDPNINRETLIIATLCFIIGIWLPGLFTAYLMNRFKRKSIYLITLLGCALATTPLLNHSEWVVSSRLIQGICFGLALNLGSTLAIDISASSNRKAAINTYARTGRIGTLTGIAAAWVLFHLMGEKGIYYFSLACNILSFCCICMVSITFHKKLKVDRISLDRFLRPHTWTYSIIVLFLGISSGLLLLNTFILAKQYIPSCSLMQLAPWCTFFLGVSVTFCVRHFVLKKKASLYLILIILALLSIECAILGYSKNGIPLLFIFFLIGGSIELLATEFLSLFIKKSRHNERSTASYSFLLSWETGMLLGFCIGTLQKEGFKIALYTSLIATILYLFIISRKENHTKEKRPSQKS